jgi:hypothetical protein
LPTDLLQLRDLQRQMADLVVVLVLQQSLGLFTIVDAPSSLQQHT